MDVDPNCGGSALSTTTITTVVPFLMIPFTGSIEDGGESEKETVSKSKISIVAVLWLTIGIS